MDIKVLQFQNKKLVERIEQRRKAEEQLKQRIEQLEQRQTTDDAVLCIVNRYWNQVRKVPEQFFYHIGKSVAIHFNKYVFAESTISISKYVFMYHILNCLA